MSTSITIPTELEAKMTERSPAQGKNVEQFALEALARAVETPSLRELFSDVREHIRNSDTPEEAVDASIHAAVKEVRKQRRA
jgi:hypothetical protein